MGPFITTTFGDLIQFSFLTFCSHSTAFRLSLSHSPLVIISSSRIFIDGSRFTIQLSGNRPSNLALVCLKIRGSIMEMLFLLLSSMVQGGSYPWPPSPNFDVGSTWCKEICELYLYSSRFIINSALHAAEIRHSLQNVITFACVLCFLSGCHYLCQ
jgi:hypothetical protein